MDIWQELKTKGFSNKLVDHIREIVLDADVTKLNIEEISEVTSSNVKTIAELLTIVMGKKEYIKQGIQYECPCCGEIFPRQEVAYSHNCESNDFETVSPEEFTESRYFWLDTKPSRDIRCAILIHGMKTRGVWQEQFVWRLNNLYLYSIPTFIYKYGYITLSPVLRILQRKQLKKIQETFNKLQHLENSRQKKFKPDVISHSFGTWLIAHLLQKYPDIQIGRLILLGSIVRPDFPWNNLIENGQIEVVLNHAAEKDIWVRISQLIIPDSGPGGQVGFVADKVLNITEPELKHSGYFTEELIEQFLSKEGKWYRFLHRPLENLPESFNDRFTCADWKPIWIIFRTLVRYLTILVLIALLALLCCILYNGIINIF